MLSALRRRLIERRDNEEGFTLIELMVVMLIIAILLAIAIPTFLGARARAQDRSTQSNLRNALTASKTSYTDLQAYANVMVAGSTGSLASIEPSLAYAAGNVGTGNNVSVATPASTPANQVVVLAGQSGTGTCWYLMDVAQTLTAAVNGETAAGTYYAADKTATGSTACNATAPGAGLGAYGAHW